MMHVLGRIFATIVVPLVGLSSLLGPKLADLAQRAPLPIDYIMAAFIVSVGLVGVACAIWAVFEHRRFVELRRSVRFERSQSRAALCLRDAIIEAGNESVVALGEDASAPLSFGGGSLKLQACLAGRDASALAQSVNVLLAEGSPFEIAVRTSANRTVITRGLPVGRRAVLYFRDEDPLVPSGVDFRGMLEALPIPVWLRRKDLSLRWANAAFLSAAGMNSLRAAIAENVALDKSERDLAAGVVDGPDVGSAKRYAFIDGKRRSLSFSLCRLKDSSVAGAALDVTNDTDSEASLKVADINLRVLDHVDTAIAVFGQDRRLESHNKSFMQFFGLSQTWLESHPSQDDILDRLREARHLPEQADYRAWKRAQSDLFNSADQRQEQLWHLPNGKSIRVQVRPHEPGGLIFLYTDVGTQLSIESSHHTVVRVQQATLDTLRDGIAAFGPDGRLKLFNKAFATMWNLTADELQDEPHLRRIAEISADRTGRDETWDIVASSVNSPQPERHDQWSTIKRQDGTVVALSMSRLPDGATLVRFENVTDVMRFEAGLREKGPVAA
jgi:PAS domain-containing protein